MQHLHMFFFFFGDLTLVPNDKWQWNTEIVRAGLSALQTRVVLQHGRLGLARANRSKPGIRTPGVFPVLGMHSDDLAVKMLPAPETHLKDMLGIFDPLGEIALVGL